MNLKRYRQKYGRFPLESRDWPVDAEEFSRIAAKGPEPMGAVALIWDSTGRILLVRDVPTSWRTGRWATPGGMLERGESPEECVRRETREEAGVDLNITALTRVILCYMSNEDRVLPFAFFQFEAEFAGGKPRPGRGIEEVAWFDRLPHNMHWRADYVEAWMRRRPSL